MNSACRSPSSTAVLQKCKKTGLLETSLLPEGCWVWGRGAQPSISGGVNLVTGMGAGLKSPLCRPCLRWKTQLRKPLLCYQLPLPALPPFLSCFLGPVSLKRQAPLLSPSQEPDNHWPKGRVPDWESDPADTVTWGVTWGRTPLHLWVFVSSFAKWGDKHLPWLLLRMVPGSGSNEIMCEAVLLNFKELNIIWLFEK